MRPLLVLALAATVTFALLAGFLGEASAAEPAKLIVRFDGDATAADRLDARQDAGTELDRALPVKGMQLVEVGPGQPAAVAERALERDPDVLYAEPDAIRHTLPLPNDPYLSQLWAVQNTGQLIRGVAGTRTPTRTSPRRGSRASPATPSSRSSTRAWTPRTRISGRTSCPVTTTWGTTTTPTDANGHGTHVSGTIAAERGNGIGVAGVADNAAKVLPIRTLDSTGSGSVSNVILAYSYAFQHGAKVVNLSLGSTSSSRAEHDAIAAFPTMLFVAAAGNGGADGVGDNNDVVPTYPCAYVLPNVLCVAASDNRDQLASFSNYGATSVDLAAPGVSIASTWLGGGYSWASGTSMATPHVSGAAALLWSASPSSLPTDISSAITGGTDARPAFAGKTVSGGRLNVLRSLRLVADVGIGEPRAGARSGRLEPGGSGSTSGAHGRLGRRQRRGLATALGARASPAGDRSACSRAAWRSEPAARSAAGCAWYCRRRGATH